MEEIKIRTQKILSKLRNSKLKANKRKCMFGVRYCLDSR